MNSDTSEKIQILIEYAKTFLGTPYIWGGNNRLEGFDCSGFVQEILRVVGIDPPGDQSAQMLFSHFEEVGYKKGNPEPGAVLFFGLNERKIFHIAFCIHKKLMIEAGGGGRRTKTKEDAANLGAMVRIRPISSRAADLVACFIPDYDTKPI